MANETNNFQFWDISGLCLAPFRERDDWNISKPLSAFVPKPHFLFLLSPDFLTVLFYLFFFSFPFFAKRLLYHSLISLRFMMTFPGMWIFLDCFLFLWSIPKKILWYGYIWTKYVHITTALNIYCKYFSSFTILHLHNFLSF